MSIDNTARLGEEGLDELVPSRYALQVGEIDVLVISDGVLPITAETLAYNADSADLATWLDDMFLPPDARRTTLCPGVCPPVRQASTPGATSYSVSNVRSRLRYSSRNCEAADRSASGTGAGMEVWEKSGDSQNSASAVAA